MKTILMYGLLLVGCTTAFAQETELLTKSIKIENFISFIANQDITETEERIYIAIETGAAGLQAEERFYIQQGIKLLSTRLPENSLIAIGTYGALGQVILPYTEVSDVKDVSSIIASAHQTKSTSLDDGIDLAYDTAALQLHEDAINTVLLLRNSNANTAAVLTTSATQLPVQEQQVTPQRKQAEAANHNKLGGAIALTALTILPDLLEIIKN